MLTSIYPKATRVLTEYRNYVVQQARTRLTKGGKHGSHKASGSLYRSVKGYISKRFNRNVSGRFTGGSKMPSLTFEYNMYGEFLDKGVKGTKSNYIGNRNTPYSFKKGKKSVPVGPIRKWVQQKGLKPGIEYAIAKSIHQKGIENTKWFSKGFDKRYDSTIRQYHSAIADDIQINITNQITKSLKKSKNIK